MDVAGLRREMVGHIVALRQWDPDYARAAQRWYEQTLRDVVPTLHEDVARAWRKLTGGGVDGSHSAEATQRGAGADR